MKTWLIAFGIIWTVNIMLFGMQRATLLISRKAGIEWRGFGELLLPSWYPITWVAILGKWGLLIAMAIFLSWKYSLGLAIGGYLISTIIPIPYGMYKGIFHNRVNQLMHIEPIVAVQLKQALNEAPF